MANLSKENQEGPGGSQGVETVTAANVLFMVGDRALFLANGMAESRVTVMTLIKQSCVLVTILCGWLVFREKGVGYRLLCAAIIIVGIVIATIGM